MWAVYALLSALFAALVAIFAKAGLAAVNANLATAIRTAIVLVLAWGVVLVTGTHHDMGEISRRSWLFLVLSGLATGASWLFYFKALQMGEVAKVAPLDKFSLVLAMVLAFVFLGEAVTAKTILAGALITAGTFALVW